MKTEPSETKKIVYQRYLACDQIGAQAYLYNSSLMQVLSRENLRGEDNTIVNAFVMKSPNGRYWLQKDFFSDNRGESVRRTEITLLTWQEAAELFTQADRQFVQFEDVFPQAEVAPA